MIIGFDASRAFVKGRTGTENYSYQLLKALAKIDRINRYIVYTKDISYSSTAVEVNDIWSGNFTFTTVNWPRLWTQGGLALKTFSDPQDVLFVPAHTLPLIRRPGLKTVVTVHDLGSKYLPKTHQLKQRIYLGFMQNYQLQTASKLIAVSEATKKDLIQQIGINPKKIAVIYEGYDQKLFKPVNGDLLINSLNQYGLTPQNYFLFVGTVQPRKNLKRLIKAYSHLASLPSLVIVGQKGWLSDEIYQLPERLGIEDRVKFLGYVPDEDMPALYSGAIALVYPSLFEGFGLPIIEAQACGCPVITSNVSSMPEVAGKGAILVDPYGIDDIVIGLKKVEDRALRSKLIEEGFRNIKRFSWGKCARETLKVLEGI